MMAAVGCLLAAATAYTPGAIHARTLTFARGALTPRAGHSVAVLRLGKAWSEYVLLRPPPDECEVEQAFEGTSFEFHRSHLVGTSCETKRVPGTVRTFIISSVLCTLIALPVLMANPAVVEKLLEWAATSVVSAR